MPSSPKYSHLFIARFIAKAYHWTPDVIDKTPAAFLDALVFAESEFNKKELQEMEMNKNG